MLAIELRHNTYFLQCNISPGLRPNPHIPLYSSTNNGPLSSHPWRFMDCTTYLQEGSYSITRRRYVRLPSDVYNLTWHYIFSLWLAGQHNPIETDSLIPVAMYPIVWQLWQLFSSEPYNCWQLYGSEPYNCWHLFSSEPYNCLNHIIAGNYMVQNHIIELTHNTYFLQCNISPDATHLDVFMCAVKIEGVWNCMGCDWQILLKMSVLLDHVVVRD